MHTYRSLYHGAGRTQTGARCAPALLVQMFYTLLLYQYKSTTNTDTRLSSAGSSTLCSCFTSTKVLEAPALLVLVHYTYSDTPWAQQEHLNEQIRGQCKKNLKFESWITKMTAEFEVCGGGGGDGGIHTCNAHTCMTALLEQALKVDLSLARAALSKVNQTPHFKKKKGR